MPQDDREHGPQTPALGTEARPTELDENQILTQAHALETPEIHPPGTCVGRYVLLGLLGWGGMGVVYAANDPELRRNVAIKLLYGLAPHPTALIREGQVLAQLTHPNIVRVYDTGVFEGRGFIAMELVEGQTLHQWLLRAPDRKSVLRVFCACARGLIAAHEAGIVHRDFKPGNVLLDANLNPYVVDFGLAREQDEGISEVAVNARFGTPGYVAPELRRGERPTPACDQFSFCVTLGQALFGYSPHASVGRDFSGGAVPTRLKRIIARGLSTLPEHRYPNMRALLDDLEQDPAVPRRRWLMGLGLVACTALSAVVATRADRTRKLCTGGTDEIKSVWNAEHATVLSNVFGKTGRQDAPQVWARTRNALDAYALGWARMRDDSCAATRITGTQSDEALLLRGACLDRQRQSFVALLDELTRVDAKRLDDVVNGARGLPSLVSCTNVEALKAPAKLPSDATSRARVTQAQEALARSQALLLTGKLTEAAEAARAPLEVAQQLSYRPLQAESYLVIADALQQSGQFVPAGEAYVHAIAAAEAGGHIEIIARAAASYVWLLSARDPAGEGFRWAEFAQAALERLNGNEYIHSLLENSLGALSTKHGQMSEAKQHYEKALAVRTQLYGAESPEAGIVHNNLGHLMGDEGNYNQAIEELRHAVRIYEAAYGMSHPRRAVSLSNLAVMEAAAGRYEDAANDAAEAIKTFEASVGDHVMYAGHTYQMLSLLHVELGEYAEAAAAARKAIDNYEKALGPDDVKTAMGLFALGSSELGLRQKDLALEHCQQAVAIFEKKGPLDGDGAEALVRLGEVLWSRGQWVEANAQFLRAKSIWEPAHGEPAAELPNALEGLRRRRIEPRAVA